MRRRGQSGFSLLEVMVAIAILAVSLTVIVRITSMNVRAAMHAKFVTNATFLARGKLAALEDDIITLGFTDTDQEDGGDFGDEGEAFRRFRWTSIIERVELPTDAAAIAQQAAQDQTQAAQTGPSANPMAAMTGMLGGFMSTLIEPVRVGLQESVRRVSVKVTWDELGREEQSFEVVAYMTDPSKLDLAMGGAGLPTGAGATGGTAGTGGTTGGGAGGSSGSRTGAAGAPANPGSQPPRGGR
jgi:general secretion pathway protein I